MMLVFGARVAAGAGSCAGGGAPFGVVVVCGCTLVAVLAGGVAPCVRLGLWPVVGVELARGVRGFQGWCPWGGVRSRRGAASFLCWWAVVSRAPGWGRGLRCGMVVLCCVVAFPFGGGGGAPCPGLVGWVDARGLSSGGVGQPRVVS